MYIEENTLDDLLHELLPQFLDINTSINNTKGDNYEKLGVYLKLKNPRARVSATQTKNIAISPIGELLWYLSGSDELEFIKYYLNIYSKSSDDGKTVSGAYGPRLISMHGYINQIENVINLLKERPNTRRAAIQIFDAKDLINIDSKDIPCTISLQFLIREKRLHLFASMRSNDIFLGLPHDIFCFTMLQEIIACELNVELGEYNHFVSSLHLYSKSLESAKNYILEGLQSTKYVMPEMPSQNVFSNIKLLLAYEKEIRTNPNFEIMNLPEVDDYWKDMITLLKIYSLDKNKKKSEIRNVKSTLKNNLFKQYIDEKFNLNIDD